METNQNTPKQKVTLDSFFIYFSLVMILIIVGVILIIAFAPQKNTIDNQTVLCISQNSIVYTQAGCLHCQEQEDLFGNKWKLINYRDCKIYPEICILEDIKSTPTWEINGEKYEGFQSLAQLKNLTGC
jgi:hypothetical protein